MHFNNAKSFLSRCLPRHCLLAVVWISTLLAGTPVVAQPVTTGTLSVPGEIAEYSILLDRPTLLHFDSMAALDRFTWSMSGPYGSVVSQQGFSSSDWIGTSLISVGPGEHRIRIQGAGDATGPYAFRLVPLVTGGTSPVGATNPGTLDPGNGAAYQLFTPAPGDRYRLSIIGQTNLNTLTVHVVDPFGNVLDSASPGSPAEFTTRVALPHQVIVNGGVRNTSVGTYGTLLALLGSGPLYPPGPTLALGAEQSINPGGAFTNRYRFTIPARTILSFNPLVAVSGDLWRLEGPGGSAGDESFVSVGRHIAAEPGEYQLTVWRSSAGAVDAMRFILHDLAGAPTIPIGISTSLTNQPAGASAFYRLPLVAGQTLAMIADGFSGFTAGTPRWEVLAPDGELLRINSTLIGSSFFDLPRWTAPVSGDYWVAMNSPSHIDSPKGIRQFRIVPVIDHDVPLTLGTEVSGTIPSFDGTVTYRFQIPSDRPVFVDTLLESPASWRIEGPLGNVSTGRFDNEYYQSLPVLPAAEYRLILRAAARETPAFRFRLLDLNAAPLITLGGNVTNNHVPPNGAIPYRIQLNAGQRLFGRAFASSGFTGERPRWTLSDPSGQLLWNTSFADTTPVTVSAPGFHILLVHGPVAATGPAPSHDFGILPVLQRNEPLVFDSIIESALTTPNETLTYRFRVDAPTRISMDGLRYADARWDIIDPSGTVVSGGFNGDSEWQYDLTPGEHRLVIGGSDIQTPTVRFRILTAAAGAALQLDVTNEVQFDTARGSRYLRVPLTAGQTLYLDHLGSVGFRYQPTIRITDPLGDPLLLLNLSDGGPIEVQTTGIHDILLTGSGENDEIPAMARFILRRADPVTGGYVLGNEIAGAITKPGERRRFEWIQAAPRHVIVDSLTPSPVSWAASGAWGNAGSGYLYNESGPIHLPAGPAQLVLNDSGDQTNAYRLRLVSFEDAPLGTLGIETEIQLNPASGVSIIAWNLVAGQRVTFRSLGRTGFTTTPQWSLYHSRHAQVGISGMGNLTYTALETGRHHLVLSGDLSETAAGGTIRFIAEDGGIVPPTPFKGSVIGFNQIIDDSTATGGTNFYRMLLTQRSAVTLDVLTDSSHRWTLRDRFGTQVDRAFLRDADTFNRTDLAPMALDPGEYELAIYDATGPFRFLLRSGAEAIAAAAGVLQTSIHTPASSSRFFRFEGQAGDPWSFFGDGYSGYLRRPIMTLSAPSGRSLTYDYTDGFTDRYTLPETGRYLMLVTSFANETATTGTNQFRWFGGETAVGEITLEVPFEVTIPTPGGRSEFRLVLDSERELMFDALSSFPQLSVSIDRFSTRLFTSSINAVEYDGYPPSTRLRLGAGEYRVVFDAGGSTTPTVRMVMRDMANARPLVFNAETAGTNSPASASVFHSFPMTAGESYLLEGIDRSGFSTSPYANLFPPVKGGLNFAAIDSYSIRYTANQSGLARLLVSGSPSDTGVAGIHRFRLWRVQDETNRLTLGTVVNGQIQQPSQVQHWTFRLTQTRRLLLDSLSNSAASVRLTGPGGEFFNGSLRSFEESYRHQIVVAPAGDYTLALSAPGLERPGFAFRLLDVSDAPFITAGVLTDASFDLSRAAYVRRFQASAGDSVYFDNVAYTGFPSANSHRFFSSSGDLLGEAYGSADFASTRLPYSGDYFLVVNGSDIIPGAPPTYRFRMVPNPTPSPESLLGNLSLADLVPENISATPDPVASGGFLTVRWNSANRGNAGANPPLTDRVILRNASGAVIASGTTTDSAGPIAPGQTHPREIILPLPEGAQSVGALAVEIAVDSTGTLREANAAGSGEANNLASRTVTGTFAPYPDLVPLVLRSSGAGWAPGSPIALLWQTANAGARNANGPWSERLIVSNANRRTVILDVTLPHPSSLAAGAATERSHSFTLPTGANGYGAFVVLLAIDSGNAVAEFNLADTAELNNTATLQAVTALDIAVAEVAIPPVIEPGIAFNVVHTLTNAGAIQAAGSWLDALVFIAPDQSETVLAQRPHTANLAPGASQRVTNTLTLPVTFPHLSGRIAVIVDSADVLAEIGESNNRGVSAAATVPAMLTLQWAPLSLREDAINPNVRGTVTRNGPVDQPLAVGLTNPDPTELAIPASVTLPAGQAIASFNATVVPDGQNDGPQTVTVRATAPGFRSGEATVTVLDADLTQLTLSLSTHRMVEGSSITGTVTRTPVAASPMLVQLLASDTAQLSVPGAVTIPSGVASATFSITAVEDDLLERTNLYNLTASAAGVANTAAAVTIVDNDIPTVTLVLAQKTVGEGDGPNATSATLTRSLVTPRAVVVSLETGNSAVVRVPANATIPANAASVTFPVATLDNANAEGPRPVAVGGFILDSVNRAPIQEIVPDVLTVTDNDGPTLTLRLAADAVAEGRTPATTATLIRNTTTTLPLTVTIASSDSTEATAPATVTIPAGSDRTSFPVNSVADGITDGNQSVLLTASAVGFVSGAATLVVSDADRPDLVLAALTFSPTGIGGESIPVTLRVENRGSTVAQGAIVQRLSLSADPVAGGDKLVGQITYPGPVPPGGSFEQTLNVRLPDQPGAYHFVAETDITGAVAEILESNNLRVSPTAVQIGPAYTATVETDVTSAVAGTAIPLRGRALRNNGSPAALVGVSIHVSVRGITRTLPVVAGPDGRFSATFQPLPTEGGLYRIAAGHPGVAMPPAQDEFQLLGFALAPLPRITVPEGETVQAMTVVENRTDIPLTGLMAELLVSHPSLRVIPTLSSNTLAGNGSIQLRLEVATVDTSAIESNVSIRLRSAEGVEGILTTRVRQEIRVPRLIATPGSLDVAMVRGRQTPVAFSVRNDGGLDTGPLRIDIPPTPWLSLSSPALLTSLAPGSNATVVLLLTPAADLPLGDYTSAIALNSDRAVLTVPAQFRAISDGIGHIEVTAEDEYTYFADGKPPLAGAEVILRDALSGIPVRTNRTGIDGRALFSNLTEAYYLVSATADKHRSFQQAALVVAGATTNVTAFLSRETIRYSFFVEPTTVEDRYSLRVESIFETQVPVPVVTIEPSVIDISQYAGEEFQIEVTVRNHGLIAADSVRIQIPGGARFTATPLVSDLGRLPGGASVKVPILIRRPAAPVGGRGAGPALDDEFDDASCSLAAQALWDYLCGPGTIGQTSPFTIFQAQHAPTDHFGCDESELYTRVFEYREIPYWTQPGADPAVAAFINNLPTAPFNYAAMTTFWRMCRPAVDLGPLGPGSRPGALAADGTASRDVCARVSLRLDQSAVLTRDAFRATLEIENDTEESLDAILVNLEIRRANGTNVTELFGIRPGERVAFTGVDGTGTLAANTTGRANWTLIPTLEAAPTNGPALFLVSGTLSYSQGGTNISIPLASAPITVYPQPELVVQYFHERDVYSDDPFTPEIEPSLPYSLALQVLNVGFGNARGLRIQGGQPQIVDNEKGLQIEFKTLATQIENQPLSPSLDVELGAIAAGTNRIARWLFSSSIQGSFTNFAASFEHTDALGGRRLSLLRSVEIHELTRIVLAGSHDGDGRPDMLVNGTPDGDFIPDQLYRSSGGVEPVQAITTASITPTGVPGDFQLPITPVTGWIYLRAALPAEAGNLLRVVRPDGSEVPASNVWTTDRFIRGGSLRPIRTNLFHLFEGSPAGTYRLVFGEPATVAPDNTPPQSRVNTLANSVPVDFPVIWAGTDPGGSGIAYYDVLVAVDRGPFTLWLTRTAATSALFRGEPGRRYAFHSIGVDQAGNREVAPATPDAETTTTLTGNQSPAFTSSLTTVVDELAFLDGSISAVDPDAGQRLSYEVTAGAPSGFVLNAVTGQYLWSPSEADGPGTWNIQVRATDNGTPARFTAATLKVTVREVNQAPSLAQSSDQLVTEGTLLSFNLSGSDPDRPMQSLRYSLVSGPPGASVNPVTGLFLWRPRPDQGGIRYDIQVRIIDDGSPQLSADSSFKVAVRDTFSDLLVVAGATAVENGASGTLPIFLNAAPNLTGLNFQLTLPPGRIVNPTIASLAADVSGATIVRGAEGRAELRLQIRPGTSLLSTRELLAIGFSSLTAPDSLLVRITPEQIVASADTGVSPDRILSRSGRIVLIGTEPILVMERSAQPDSAVAVLTVYGAPGMRYALEGRAGFHNQGPWSPLAEGETVADTYLQTWNLPIGPSEAYYRARTLGPR